MGKAEKLIHRLFSHPKDFTWDELVSVLGYFGYEEMGKGKTSGSRRKYTDKDGNVFHAHKPHPSKIVKSYVIKALIDHLTKLNNLSHE